MEKIDTTNTNIKEFYLNGDLIKGYVNDAKKWHGVVVCLSPGRGAESGNLVVMKSEEYNNGMLHGEQTLFDYIFKNEIVEGVQISKPTLALQSINTFDNGKLIQSIAFYDNGKPMVIDSYAEDGLLNGRCQEYYPSGMIRSESNFIEGELHGTLLKYNREGDLVYSADYKSGLLHGQEKVFLNNKIIGLKTYINGRIEGKIVEANKDGVIEYSIKNNVKNGLYKEKDLSGKTRLQGNYLDGKRTGKWIETSSEGQWNSIVNYKNGILEGIYCKRIQNEPYGELGRYINGRKEGLVHLTELPIIPVTERFPLKVPNGLNSVLFRNGNQIGYLEWYDGKVVERGDLKDGKKHGISVRLINGEAVKVEFSEGKEISNTNKELGVLLPNNSIYSKTKSFAHEL